MYSILEQLNIDFKMEKVFDWSQTRKYDFYLKDFNYIIETHGGQHYAECSRGKLSLKETQTNDKLKNQLADDNKIDKYIIIDCRNSNLEFIKNNVLNSEMAKLFDLSAIDWLKCEEYACSSLVKVACDIFNQGIINTSYISQMMKLERSTIYHYLQIGNELGWCCYDKSIISRLQSKKSINRAQEVLCINNNMIFKSCKELQDTSLETFGVYLGKRSISRVCKGTRKQYKGFKFEFIKK